MLGLGNPYLTDDGVGVRVAEAVAAMLPPGAAVETREVSVGGLTLMENMVGWPRVILVDALQTGEEPPGTVRRMTLDELRSISPTQHSASPHDATLPTALAMADRMGLDVPDELVIFAIEVENVMEFGEEPTPEVAEAIPGVIEAVLDQLRSWGAVPTAAG